MLILACSGIYTQDQALTYIGNKVKAVKEANNATARPGNTRRTTSSISEAAEVLAHVVLNHVSVVVVLLLLL